MGSVLQRAWHRREQESCGIPSGTLTQPTGRVAKGSRLPLAETLPVPGLLVWTAVEDNGLSQHKSYLHRVLENEMTRGIPSPWPGPAALTEWH